MLSRTAIAGAVTLRTIFSAVGSANSRSFSRDSLNAFSMSLSQALSVLTFIRQLILRIDSMAESAASSSSMPLNSLGTSLRFCKGNQHASFSSVGPSSAMCPYTHCLMNDWESSMRSSSNLEASYVAVLLQKKSMACSIDSLRSCYCFEEKKPFRVLS